MKRFKLLLLSGLCPLMLFSCTGEFPSGRNSGCGATLTLHFAEGGKMRSSSVADENRVDDLNLWVYSSDGNLAESHYFASVPISADGSVTFETDCGAGSSVTAVANAGRVLAAPGTVSDRGTYTFRSDGAVLMCGECSLHAGSGGLEGEMVLSRLMAKITLSIIRDAYLFSNGVELGTDIVIDYLKLRNCIDEFSLVPGNPFSSGRDHAAGYGSVLCDADSLTREDMMTLYGGGQVCLYCLPDYTAEDYSWLPVNGPSRGPYVEAKIDFNALPESSAGSVFYRFNVGDSVVTGVRGGCSYSVGIMLKNDSGKLLWRRDDWRFRPSDSIAAGSVVSIDLLQVKPEGYCMFSLDESSAVTENAAFRIAENVQSGTLYGVTLTAKGNGTATVYVFDADPSSGARPLGWTTIRAD